MAELRNSIERIRFVNVNFEHRYFIPEAALFEVVSEPAIKMSLRSFGVPVYEIRDLAISILQGARKCFAILILIGRGEAISNFFRRDSLQRSYPDDRLPYTLGKLQQIFEDESTSSTISHFLEKQWEVAIPIMHQHMTFRKLETEAILPFLHEEATGRGSMGTAWKIELHPQCHRLPLENHKVIRKQIECGNSEDMAIFLKELENLSLLTHLKHPNIVQLYCSYIYRQRYNLIFAVANGGSLADFLNGQNGEKELEGPQLLLALADLASAIDALHNFTSDVFDLSLSGCHHDLAPRNILIHNETFLLADFGLSTFRNAEEDSLTIFKEVRGSYVAPECQTLHDGHVKSQKISRASDIWSFGCILSEVLTNMLLGSNGVAQFRDKRKVQVTPEIEWFRFHRGPGTPNHAVICWLDDLQVNREPFYVKMIDLIRQMLSIDPSKRPRSARVLTVLRGISILSLASTVNLALESLLSVNRRSIDRVLDKMRFQSWLFAFDRLLGETERSELDSLDFDFPKTTQTLKETRRILEGVEGDNVVNHQQLSLLRYQHARLIEALPSSYRLIAEERLVKQVLQIDSVEQLGRLSTAITEAGDKDIGVLIAVKHLTALAETGRLIEQSDLLLDRKNITLKSDIDIHSLALLAPTSELILIEWLRYRETWADEVIGIELRRRLTSVVGLLHAESTTQVSSSLRCKGIFHHASNGAFGVIYSLPTPGTQQITLHGLLSAKGLYRPLLEYRFRLAFEICKCIYTLHKVGWLHRNLHSMNVLFSPPEGAENVEWAKNPKILGFASSRENRLDSFTHGPDQSRQLRSYQHPEYLERQERYREEFDYYSVGMLLLEIGFWSTLSSITKDDHFQGVSDEEFRKQVLATRVPQLRITMGTRYMEATRICLEGGFAGRPGDSGDTEDTWYASFQSQVIDRIPLIDER